jgi:hypothetical protein
MVIKWSYHPKRKMPQIVSTPTSSGGYCDCGPEDACENVSIVKIKGLIRPFIYSILVIMILLSKAS